MGRKPKEDSPNIVRDKVGEKTDLSLCPICPYAASQPDCFANIEGHCTALKVTEDSDTCSFYKSEEQAMADAKRNYQRLKEMGRSDLISKYIKALTALGLLDDDIEMAEQYGERFESFREQNYQEQLEKAVDNELDDDLLTDDENEDSEDEDEEIEDEEETDDGDDPWDDNGE